MQYHCFFYFFLKYFFLAIPNLTLIFAFGIVLFA